MSMRSLVILGGIALILAVALVLIRAGGPAHVAVPGAMLLEPERRPSGPRPSEGTSLRTVPSRPPVRISRFGVNKLTPSTAFSEETVARLFPEHEVVPSVRSVDGAARDALTVRQADGTPLMTVTPDSGTASGGRRVGSVLVSRPGLGTSRGEIGMTFLEVFNGRANDCLPGTGDYAGSVLCPDPGAPNIRYVFTGAWNGPEDSVPPPHVLQHWVMWALLWTPPD